MKKFTIIIIVLIAMTIETYAQIPNSGFENWTTVHNCSEPTNWHSLYFLVDSTGTYCPVTQSTDHYPTSMGSYSVRIANNIALWNAGNLVGWGILTSTKQDDKPLFPVTGHPVSLSGYYKFIPENGDTMNIDFHLYKSGVEITSGNLQSKVAATNWTPFQVLASNQSYISADSARIGFSPSNEPKNGSKPHGNSVLYIDNLVFNTTLTEISKVYESNRISVYPNPFSTQTVLQTDNSFHNATLTVYDCFGQTVAQIKNLSGQTIVFNRDNLSSGLYFVRLTQDNKIIAVDKLEITAN